MDSGAQRPRHIGPITTQISTLTVATYDQLPNRPGFGSHGTNVVLWANYFKMKVKSPPLWKYDVTLSEAKPVESASETSEATREGSRCGGTQGPQARPAD